MMRLFARGLRLLKGYQFTHTAGGFVCIGPQENALNALYQAGVLHKGATTKTDNRARSLKPIDLTRDLGQVARAWSRSY